MTTWIAKREKQKERTMKKIMFNDSYGLTQAVLEGKKTMTRRIIQDIEIDWNRRGRVTLPVGGFENDTLLMDVRSILSDAGINDYPAPAKYQPAYNVGEEIAIAQKYWDLRNCDAFYEALQKADPTFPLECIRDEAGCHNKMFVRADWMPHRIRITKTKLERLQDISDEDCLREGVIKWTNCYIVSGIMEDRGRNNVCFDTPRDAFAALIDRISGKGTWERNPWVYAYEFELVR
jgi:hypothetical protein